MGAKAAKVGTNALSERVVLGRIPVEKGMERLDKSIRYRETYAIKYRECSRIVPAGTNVRPKQIVTRQDKPS